MRIDRRQFLLATAGGVTLLAKPSLLMAEARDEALFAAARRDDRGTYSAAMFSFEGDVRSVELPGRGHDIALRPGSGEWVAFARRPGQFGVAVPAHGGSPIWFAAKEGRHFFGHGVFSADGKLLYTTENDFVSAKGMIGIRDATAGYRQIAEFSAGGVEPHDIALMADGRTLVIANGGIRTHPDSGARELNIPEMQPSLVYLDLSTGDIVEEHLLDASLHKLSIRHLALAGRDSVVFGCQYRGPEEDHPALVGFHRRGEAPILAAAPAEIQSSLKNYLGSVTADSAGEIIAASTPKAGLITYFDARTRRYLGSSELADGCGVAPTRHQARFLLTSGNGWLVEAEEQEEAARRSTPYHWDNHAILMR